MASSEATAAIAVRAQTPLKLDGTLSDAVWQAAPAYPLVLPRALTEQGRSLQEGGTARFGWDDRYLYMGVDLTDSDIVAEGTADGLMHNALGDTCELLIKPEGETWYWEFHLTPAGKTSSFFFPGRGRLGLPSCLAHRCELRGAAQCDGTLNDYTDRDRGWSGELAVPISELTARGERFGPGHRWRVLVGRYNFSRYLLTRGPELSSFPGIARVDFHCFEEYMLLDPRK